MSNGGAKGGSTRAPVPDQLYHTTLTVVDYHADTSGATRSVYVLGTHTTLESAKEFSLKALSQLGYERDDFETYASRAEVQDPDAWTHGDGVLVYTKAPAGQEFYVGIDTTPNNASLSADAATHEPLLPKGIDHLQYVMQNQTDYNRDRSGAAQSSEIEGCYVHRADAINAAKRLLKTEMDDFAQYDERRDVAQAKTDWPFGDDVWVHAVAQTGENYNVAVRTIPSTHHKYRKAVAV